MDKFAERLKELRTENNLTQVQLAKETGISRSNFYYWESGKKIPSADAVITLARYFGVPTDYLLGESD